MKYKKLHGPRIPCSNCRYNARRIKIADCFKCDDYCIKYNTFITSCSILYQCQNYKENSYFRHIVLVI